MAGSFPARRQEKTHRQRGRVLHRELQTRPTSPGKSDTKPAINPTPLWAVSDADPISAHQAPIRGSDTRYSANTKAARRVGELLISCRYET